MPILDLSATLQQVQALRRETTLDEQILLNIAEAVLEYAQRFVGDEDEANDLVLGAAIYCLKKIKLASYYWWGFNEKFYADFAKAFMLTSTSDKNALIYLHQFYRALYELSEDDFEFLLDEHPHDATLQNALIFKDINTEGMQKEIQKQLTNLLYEIPADIKKADEAIPPEDHFNKHMAQLTKHYLEKKEAQQSQQYRLTTKIYGLFGYNNNLNPTRLFATQLAEALVYLNPNIDQPTNTVQVSLSPSQQIKMGILFYFQNKIEEKCLNTWLNGSIYTQLGCDILMDDWHNFNELIQYACMVACKDFLNLDTAIYNIKAFGKMKYPDDKDNYLKDCDTQIKCIIADIENLPLPKEPSPPVTYLSFCHHTGVVTGKSIASLGYGVGSMFGLTLGQSNHALNAKFNLMNVFGRGLNIFFSAGVISFFFSDGAVNATLQRFFGKIFEFAAFCGGYGVGFSGACVVGASMEAGRTLGHYLLQQAEKNKCPIEDMKFIRALLALPDCVIENSRSVFDVNQRNNLANKIDEECRFSSEEYNSHDTPRLS